MKVFISADMEGISGVTDPEDVLPGKRTYEFCRKLFTQDVNAAIEGALEAGATEILVNESHGPMRNLLVDELHPKAEVIRGFFKPMTMVQGLDETFDAAMFVGYHGKAGAPNAILNHTLLGTCIQRFKLNGKEVGEAGLNAAVAGALNVPVVLVTGDSQVAEEVSIDIPGVRTVAVKTGIDKFTAKCLHPSVAQEMIRKTAKEAVLARKEIAPLALKGPYVVEIEFMSTSMAATANFIPGTELLDGRTIRYQSDDIVTAMPVIMAMMILAIQASNTMNF